MEYKLTKLEYELIKEYQNRGYKYLSLNYYRDIVFSKYPINELDTSEIRLDISLFKSFKQDKDYCLDEIIENIINVK